MTRVVVTGSQGFVGRHLRAALELRGVEVIGVGRPASGAEIEVDLARRDLDVDRIVRDVGPVDGVLWLAASITRGSSVGREARENVEVIAVRAAEWMEAAYALGGSTGRTPPHFVFCSSVKLYGASPSRIVPGTATLRPDPWSYGCAKALGERLLAATAARCGATWCTVRPAYVYGPGQHLHNAIPRFLQACWRGEAPVVFGEGREVRDDVFVGDVAEALAEAWARRATGAFNAASGQEVTLGDVARACCLAVEELGGPGGLAPVLDPSRPPKSWLDQAFDVSRTEAVLGVHATSLLEGLRREAAWIRDGARPADAVDHARRPSGLQAGPGVPTAARAPARHGVAAARRRDVRTGPVRKVVVTGASIALERRLGEALARRGCDVVVLRLDDLDLGEDRALEDVGPHLGPDVALLHLARARSAPHASAREARRARLDVDVLGTMRLLEACGARGASRVVLGPRDDAAPDDEAAALTSATRDIVLAFEAETGIPGVFVDDTAEESLADALVGARSASPEGGSGAT